MEVQRRIDCGVDIAERVAELLGATDRAFGFHEGLVLIGELFEQDGVWFSQRCGDDRTVQEIERDDAQEVSHEVGG